MIYAQTGSLRHAREQRRRERRSFALLLNTLCVAGFLCKPLSDPISVSLQIHPRSSVQISALPPWSPHFVRGGPRNRPLVPHYGIYPFPPLFFFCRIQLLCQFAAGDVLAGWGFWPSRVSPACAVSVLLILQDFTSPRRVTLQSLRALPLRKISSVFRSAPLRVDFQARVRMCVRALCILKR